MIKKVTVQRNIVIALGLKRIISRHNNPIPPDHHRIFIPV
jgi:hypothetical protein